MSNAYFRVHATRKPFTYYAVLSVAVFILCVWYIYFSPSAEEPPTNNSNPSSLKIIQAFTPMQTPHTHLSPDAYLCNSDDAVRYLLPTSSGAKCMDGSQPAFYYRKGTGEGRNKWLVFFEGGGWCFDADSCKARAKTILGSSKDYPLCIAKEAMFHYLSASRTENPMLSSWNVVRVRYCDGGSYAGNTVVQVNGTTLHFRGALNRDETIRTLLSPPFNMKTGREIVLGGCSAGALGLYMGIDRMATIIRLHAPLAIVRGLALSGFFPAYSSLQPLAEFEREALKFGSLREDGLVGGRLDYAGAMRRVFREMNMTGGTNRECVKKMRAKKKVEREEKEGKEGERRRLEEMGEAGEEGKGGLRVERDKEREGEEECIFAQTLLPFIRTPIFSVQSQYDHWQLLHVLGRDYTPPLVQTFAYNLSALLLSSAFRNVSAGHGVYLESCAHHCMSCSERGEDTWNGPRLTTQAVWNQAPAKFQRVKYSPGGAFKAWLLSSIQMGSLLSLPPEPSLSSSSPTTSSSSSSSSSSSASSSSASLSGSSVSLSPNLQLRKLKDTLSLNSTVEVRDTGITPNEAGANYDIEVLLSNVSSNSDVSSVSRSNSSGNSTRRNTLMAHYIPRLSAGGFRLFVQNFTFPCTHCCVCTVQK